MTTAIESIKKFDSGLKYCHEQMTLVNAVIVIAQRDEKQETLRIAEEKYMFLSAAAALMIKAKKGLESEQCQLMSL